LIEQYRWRQVSFWDDEYGLVIDAEAELLEGPGRHAHRTHDGHIVGTTTPSSPPR
jgi:hypothetical protein